MSKEKALIVGDNHIKTDPNSHVVEVSIEVFYVSQGDYIVSYCPALDLSSFGKNETESRSNFEEALQIFIDETQKRGSLEKVLLDLGWGLKKLPIPKYTPPKLEASLVTYPIKNKTSFKERVRIPI